MVKKGAWVVIENVVLPVGERAENLPEDTKKTPLKKWIKGYLQQDAEMGDTVKIKTIIDRDEEGVLVDVNPAYLHTFGEFVPELLVIGKQVKEIAFGGGK